MKIATVMSGLSPLGGAGRPPKAPSLPSIHAPTTAPGIGERMRRETGSALEQALAKGKLAALAHFGVKAAMMPPMAETASLGHMMPSLGGVMKPIKRGLGLAALGAAGATAYGLHQQNKRDQEGRDLVYAPLGGI